MPTEVGYQIRAGAPPGGEVLESFWGPYAEVNATQGVARWAYRVNGGARMERVTRFVSEPDGRGNAGGSSYMGNARTKQDASQEGSELGSALATVIGISATSDFQALFALGALFAKINGYTDLDIGNAYVGGFVQGFQHKSQGSQIEGPQA